jgi:serine/threonine-protein kinase RsbW
MLGIQRFVPGSDGRMTAETTRIEVALETLLDSIALAEEISLRIARGAGFDEEDCHRIEMSVREGAINAFQYGNREQRDKKIYLVFELEPDKLVIHVLDQGRGFNLADVPDPLAEQNLLKTSGRGIFLMRSFMDEFAVRPGRSGGVEVIMAKRYPRSRADSQTRSAQERRKNL